MVMSDYDQRPNYVKDTKLVALMFGGLGYFYTDRQTDRRSLKQHQGARGGSSRPSIGDGGSRRCVCAFVSSSKPQNSDGMTATSGAPGFFRG